MIIYNGVVHPMDGPVIPRGYVTFEGGKITAVGPMEELGETPEGLDAQGGISCPGLSTPTAIWGCLVILWALRRTTATSPLIPAPPSCGPSMG